MSPVRAQNLYKIHTSLKQGYLRLANLRHKIFNIFHTYQNIHISGTHVNMIHVSVDFVHIYMQNTSRAFLKFAKIRGKKYLLKNFEAGWESHFKFTTDFLT